ncbi:multidrug DMT transporter permease [Spongiactinospora gelatinilytica]|uniref:Multidrug DMT transporter permease n=1 Tax=Spongiactinospora gelatinilytica TaxID=2666298 RepID=A0A2W2FWT1_9ACTN|nr:response regulator [Spongiactinospora gelatinilytica]PZG41996.1 multidrug DMT transporter permease [Spongiactinospora gelatinilytica]
MLWVSSTLVALSRMSENRALGIEIEFREVERLLAKAVDNGDQETLEPQISGADRQAVIKRVDHAAAYLRGGRMLWVDDLPRNNIYLKELFRQLGMVVDSATSTGEAMACLDHHKYDLVISDIYRESDPQAGIKMLHEFRTRGISLPVIIHAARFDPTLGVDPMIFGGTNRIDEVVHYVIDVMERVPLRDA